MCRILQILVIGLLLLTTSARASFAQLIDGSVIQLQQTATRRRRAGSICPTRRRLIAFVIADHNVSAF
jgi:hypothetical protein